MPNPPGDPLNKPKALAAVQLVERTGATTLQLRYQDDAEPVVWIACAQGPTGVWVAAADLHPTEAIFRLLDRLVDGATCAHCGRMTGFNPDDPDALDPQELMPLACWYQWDPERQTFRRGCEGDDDASGG